MLDVFKNMRVLDTKKVNKEIVTNDDTKRMNFLNGWTVTISSLLKLWMTWQKQQILCYVVMYL